MALKAVHESLDEIPDEYRTLYTEKSGKYELTGIQGVKTQADVDRLSEAIKAERAETAKVKSQLSAWGDLNHEDVLKKLDRIPELEAAAKGKLDENQIEEIVTRRVNGTIKSQLSPLERKISTLEKEREELRSSNDAWTQKDRTRKIRDTVRRELTSQKITDAEIHDDVFLWADRVFEVREDDGSIVTRDGVGVTPGLDPGGWLSEMQSRKRHWWGETVGGGSAGTNGRGVVPGFSGKNPFSAEHWNMTEQSRVYREMGRERCEQLAKAAGTTLGGQRPAAKK